MHEERTKRLGAFVDWAKQHISGDEKGEAQIYLDRLFQAFGQQGLIEAGGHAEFRIKKASEDGGGTSFADYVWKPVVLFEMKKRGVDLARHRRQAEEYWWRLVPNRPQYVVLCNFDRFDIYDFNTQIDSPKDSVTLADLPRRWGPLAFLFPTQEKPQFDNDHIAVTRDAADLLARCYTKLETRKVDEDLRRRFILQMLVALFAEDIGLLPKYLVAGLLDECKSPAASYDLLGDLFAAMNNARGNPGGRFKGVRYFNGGLFADPARIELHDDEINQLKQAAKSDWSKVSPEIFGTLFEHSLGKEERHAYGAHFTSPVDIMKIVKPTIVEPWTAAIESAKTLKQLRSLQDRLHRYTVLDPACGSGNFLYLAYRELKRVEFRLLERIGEFSSTDPHQLRLESVTARQFFGLDINRFAIELAKVTMMIARKLAIDELHVVENALPLDNLDQNFLAVDALLSVRSTGFSLPQEAQAEACTPNAEHFIPTPWPRADVIIGNPPFLGAKRLKPERGPDYVNAVRKLYPDVPGMADYCVYWFRRAHDHLPDCTHEDPLAGRAGLVGTQNIRNNQSRVGGLDHIVKTGTIIEAVDNQPWSGEANVHVSIANWVKTQEKELLPEKRRLWFKLQEAQRTGSRRKSNGRADKEYELNHVDCDRISPSLSDKTDISIAVPLAANMKPQRSFNGQMLGHEGFLLTAAEAASLIKADRSSQEVLLPYLNGREFLTGDGRPDRFVLDFGQRDQLSAAAHPAAFAWVQQRVLPDRERKAQEGIDADGNMRSHHKAFLARWWQLSFGRPELVSIISKLPRYIVCSLVTKRAIFEFIHQSIRPSNLLQVFTFADNYTFGILQSNVHWLWFKHQSSKLKSDYRFGENIWTTFPWPQSPTVKQIDAVAAAAVEVRRIRTDALAHLKGGLRALYRTLELPGANPLKDAHATLDAAVLAAYGFSPKKDRLAQLLTLNLSVSAAEKAGQPVTPPGIPSLHPDPARLVTDDCIRP